MERLCGYLRVGLATSWNIVVYAVTLGAFLPLEGRVRRGRFRNWAHRFRYRPWRYLEPTSEEEIVRIVRESEHVRVFGSGHSFNAGVVVREGVLLSLDSYTGVVGESGNRLRVRAGTRVRDVTRALEERGLAFSALPSHDAQSIGGILSTDVHGTGRDWGFVSQHVTALRIVDGTGTALDCGPEDDLFRAAIGGIGAVGIIVEVEVRAARRFLVEQKVELAELAWVESNLDRLLAKHQHLSLYLFPFTTRVQVNTWNCTDKRRSFLGSLREFLAISLDACMAAWAGNAIAYLGLLPRLSGVAHRLKRGTDLVLESAAAFNRTIYHLHQELEFTVPFADTFTEARRFMQLYESLYREDPLPYVLFEVRFTPEGHERTLIGAGRERRSTWIDLVCNDSPGFERYYAAAEDTIRRIGARPHLGKFMARLDARDMARLYGEAFAHFQALARKHDPEGRFVNPFSERVLGL